MDQIRRSGLFLTLTAVYTPKGFILHAASLDQAFAHCPIFDAAATRRCPGSVSVPMWRVNLSVPLPVVGLVGRYPTNNLIGHGPLPDQRTFDPRNMRCEDIIRYYRPFRTAIPVSGVRYPCITHPFATNRTLSYPNVRPVRLACLSHAASVRSEPGSNSSVYISNILAGPIRVTGPNRRIVRINCPRLGCNRGSNPALMLKELRSRPAQCTAAGRTHTITATKLFTCQRTQRQNH